MIYLFLRCAYLFDLTNGLGIDFKTWRFQWLTSQVLPIPSSYSLGVQRSEIRRK
jgi:hypothetical protein